MCATSIPANVAAAEWNALKPSIGPCDPLDEAMILRDNVVKIFGLNDTDDPTNTRKFEDRV